MTDRSPLVEKPQHLASCGHFGPVELNPCFLVLLALPEKPTKRAGLTHQHPLLRGLRPHTNRGVTILATAGNIAYVRDLTTRPYQMKPDPQRLETREPIIEVIAEVVRLATETREEAD